MGLSAGQPVWWLQCLTLATLAGLLVFTPSGERTSWRAAAWYGFSFAVAWLFVTFGWIRVAMHTYGGLPWLPSAVAAFALSALLAAYYALACGLCIRWTNIPVGVTPINFSAMWLMAELARGTFFTGFGWGGSGYAHVDGPLSGYAPWVGVYGISALSAWLAMSMVCLVAAEGLRSRVRTLFMMAALVILGYLVPTSGSMTQSHGTLGVSLLQGNIPQDEKFQPGKGIPMALEWYSDQLNRSSQSLVIAPETAIPLLPEQIHPEYWSSLVKRFQTGEQAALIGMPMGNFREGYSNSVVGLRPGGQAIWRYDKQHLVPFGEFIPPWFKWFTTLMHIPLGDFNRGRPAQPPFIWGGQSLSTNICYESLFSELLAEQFAQPARAPTILVNVSNLAWFGGTLALDQHLQIARMRTLEFGRPYLLATNTGATAMVDHQGRVIADLPRDTRGALVGQVEGRTGITPYASWMSRWGLWPYWLAALCIVTIAFRRRLTKR